MSSTSLAILLKVVPRGSNVPLLYQNYRISAPIVFGGNPYLHAGFEIRSYPKVDLSLSSDDTSIVMALTSQLSSILRTNNDLKRAVVTAYFIQPGETVPPKAIKRVVSHATREGGLIMFTLRSATDALKGAVLTKYIDAQTFPELPHYKPRL